MKTSYTSIFDILGPIMVGPSSSHTSGAAKMAWMARQIFKHKPDKVIGGILGFREYDLRIKNAYEEAAKEGVEIEFREDHETNMLHPNTIDIVQEDKNGNKLFIRGESIGGGRVRITKINDIKVDFNGDYSTMIIAHRDKPGTIAYITNCLARYEINIAYMKMFREERGEKAVVVIETDNFIPDALKVEILAYETVSRVELIEL